MKGNSLVQELNDLTVQCLPANIPSKIEVDVTPLVSGRPANTCQRPAGPITMLLSSTNPVLSWPEFAVEVN